MIKDLFLAVFAVMTVALYFLPSILADRNGRRNVLLLALLNALFGWTVVGWLAALYWALHPDNPKKVVRTLRTSRRAQAHATVEAIVTRARARRIPATQRHR
jgi:MFS family permease